MSEYRTREEKRSYRSLNTYIVIFVFLVMLMTGGVCIIFFNILDAFGMINDMYMVPMLFPLIIFCACVIIGSFLTALLSGLLLKPLRELETGLMKVSKGDFKVRLNEDAGNPAIQSIQSNFNAMAKELESTELFRNNFINDFSHEFKTPMVSVYGFAKQLKKGGLTKEQEQEYIDIIITESQRLINMSGNILTLNRLENTEIITDKRQFSLDEEIRRSVLLLEEQWSRKDITINPDLEPTEFYGNPEMLKQVWLNVIGNSIKYTNPGGNIDIKLSSNPKNPDEIRISVKDNGIGMDKATCKRIFDKFYQGDASRSTGGNGLGLAMVKRIVELCSGRISVVSEPGKGTDFRIYLPKENEPADNELKSRMLSSVNTAGLKH